MKQELHINLTFRQRLEQFLDILIERIIDVSDFLIFKHITWTEIALFGFSAFRAAWFIVFGVQNKNYDYYFSDQVWTTVFVAATLIHFAGFFLKSFCLRIAAGYFYAVIWFFLGCLAVWSKTTAPAVPHMVLLTLLSLVVLVRLSNEHACDEK